MNEFRNGYCSSSLKNKHQPYFLDAYKTWTPGPWTTSVDLVHGPFRGPRPWTTPVDYP